MADANHSTNSTPSPPKSWGDTPEAVITGLPDGYLGIPLSLLSCVLARAEAVVILLSAELEHEDRNPIADDVLVHALWDVSGNLEIARNMVKRWTAPKT